MVGYDNGYWCALPAPIRVVVVRGERDERGQQLHAFVVCEPANNYYGVMTKSEWMPALVAGNAIGAESDHFHVSAASGNSLSSARASRHVG